MSVNVSFVVMDRPFLTACSEEYQSFGQRRGNLLIYGDNGESVSIGVGSPDYARAVAEFINKLAEDLPTQLRASMHLVEAQDAAE